MNITEFIIELKKLKKVYGDAELLFPNMKGEAHYHFEADDWSDPICPFAQLLIEGCVKDENN